MRPICSRSPGWPLGPVSCRALMAVGSDPTAARRYRWIKTSSRLLPRNPSFISFLPFLSFERMRRPRFGSPEGGGAGTAPGPATGSMAGDPSPLSFSLFSLHRTARSGGGHCRWREGGAPEHSSLLPCGGATVVPFASARVRPEPRAALSSGPAVVPFSPSRCAHATWR